jgi:hypothetical protein
MAAFDPATLDRWRALAIVDRDGTTVGTISEFYLDRETGYPTWALVNTGLFGASQTFVPLVYATEISDGLQVPYEKSHIKDTPRVDLHDELSPEEEAALFAHYGVEYRPSSDMVAPPDEEPGSEPGPELAEAEAVEGPGPVPAEPGAIEGPGPVPAEPGSDEGPGSVPVDPGSVDRDELTAFGPTDVDAETFPANEAPYSPSSGAAAGTVPDEPGTADPDDATLVATGGFGPASKVDEGPPDAPGEARSDPGADPSQVPPPSPDLSRTAPVEPGLPGSTAASPGPGPATIGKGDGDPARGPADEAGWPPSFDDNGPADRPAGASDRWREAKLAAERNRIARAAAAQPEERSPLERARRRLERLVGGGQDQPDLDEISPADREAAERARRARLGLEDDDPRRR